MINVSNEFLETIKYRTNFIQTATITFLDGTVIELGQNDFTLKNNTISDGTSSNGLPLGATASRSIKIDIINFDDKYSSYDFLGAVIHLFLSLPLSNNKVEKISMGYFTVVSPETYGETVIISACDYMYKLDKDYNTEITFPATVRDIMEDVCNKCGILLLNNDFKNNDFVVEKKPEKLTCRQIVGYVALIAYGNARFNRDGYLEIISYDPEMLKNIEIIVDGGNYSYGETINYDGGSFNYNDGVDLDGGDFSFIDRNYHNLKSWITLKVDTDDVVITGVKTSSKSNNNEETEYMYGALGYVLSFKNPLISGKEKTFVDMIGSFLVGMRFRKFIGDYIAYPIAEFMDYCIISDRKGRYYYSIITDVSYTIGGRSRLSNSAIDTIRNSSKIYSESAKTLVEANKLIEEEKNARQVAVEILQKELANNNGMYLTEVIQPDESVVRYLHDKPSLGESKIVWKFTIDAFGISNDGGKTYPYGMDVSGTAILEKLYASKITADYIYGGLLTLGGTDNTHGRMRMLNSNGSQYGKWDKDSFQIGGDNGLIATSSQIQIGGSYGFIADGSSVKIGGDNGLIATSSQIQIGGSNGLVADGSSVKIGGDNGISITSERIKMRSLEIRDSEIRIKGTGYSRGIQITDGAFRIYQYLNLEGNSTQLYYDGLVIQDVGSYKKTILTANSLTIAGNQYSDNTGKIITSDPAYFSKANYVRMPTESPTTAYVLTANTTIQSFTDKNGNTFYAFTRNPTIRSLKYDSGYILKTTPTLTQKTFLSR